jgi:Na+/proline symporter
MPPVPQPQDVQLVQLAWIDWAVILLYGVFMFGVAFWAFPKIKNCGGFYVGSRKMGKLMMMAAAFAGGTNANHPIGVSAACFQKGMAGMWLSLTWMLITPFFWLYPPALRRLRIVTMADVVRMRYGPFMAGVFKTVLLLVVPISMGLGIKSAAIVLQVMTGGSLHGWQAEAVVVIPTIAYTLIGGVIAAYATDIYQSLLIVLLSFILIPFAIVSAGGIAPLDAGIGDEFTSLFMGATGDFGFWWIFWFAIGITFSATISSGWMASGAKNEMAARMNIFGLVLKRFCTVGWGLVGVVGIALYAGHEMVDPASGIPGAGPDNVFALAAGDLLPVVLRGLMVASILAAVMSSLDAAMLKFSAMFVNNVYQEHMVREASASHYLWMARVMATVGVLIGWWIASSITDIVEFTTIVEPLGSLTGIAILVALFWRRATRAGAIASVFVAAPLFLAVNRPSWPDWEWVHAMAGGPVSLFEMLQLTPVATWLGDLYGLDLFDPANGYLNADGLLATLPVQVKYPMYIVPALLTLIVVSLLTKQHNQRAVDEFYCRLDTPVGEEGKIKAAGFQVDQLELLDKSDLAIEADKSGNADRLLLVDFLRLPGLLARKEVKLSDYKWDWIGLFGSVVFVTIFILAVEMIGKFF